MQELRVNKIISSFLPTKVETESQGFEIYLYLDIYPVNFESLKDLTRFMREILFKAD